MALTTTSHREDLFNYPCKSFNNHLVFPNNSRILFSGKFGLGKTYFLNYFFKEEVQKEVLNGHKYNSFHIYPVNYSIASNEDIFRYIKYDVITSLLTANVEVQHEDFSSWDKVPSYIKANPLKVFATLIYMVPKVGKDIIDLYEKFESLRKDFESYDEKEGISKGSKLIKQLESVELDEGSIYENSIITKLISNILFRHKQETGRENVLIIDDLDRIDPEHIFRLLNVFAAHLDNPFGLPNKLGFDKVILVCDIGNIKNIFKAKYGVETDFNGYIDKFYSCEVFYLDNHEILSEIAYEAFKSIVFLSGNEQHHKHYRSRLFNYNNFAVELLQLFISNGKIGLRTLLTRIENKIPIDIGKTISFDFNIQISQIDYPFLVHFYILKSIIGSYEDIKQYVKQMPKQSINIRHFKSFCENLIYFLIAEQHKFTESNEYQLFKLDKLILRYNVQNLQNREFKIQTYEPQMDSDKNWVPYQFTKDEFMYLLSEFLDLLYRTRN